MDYKTDRDESGAAEYALQLRLYALALERYAGRLPDRAVLYYLAIRERDESSLSNSGSGRGARRGARAGGGSESLEFPLKVGEQCRQCVFL